MVKTGQTGQKWKKKRRQEVKMVKFCQKWLKLVKNKKINKIFQFFCVGQTARGTKSSRSEGSKPALLRSVCGSIRWSGGLSGGSSLSNGPSDINTTQESLIFTTFCLKRKPGMENADNDPTRHERQHEGSTGSSGS